MIKTKKQMFIIIGAFIFVMLLTTVTYAFFNYTRTGVANTIRTGRIYFNTSQNGTINLTNAFPIASNEVSNINDQVTVRIQGDTTYAGGEEFLISLVSVNNTIISGSTEKKVPVSYVASYTGTPVATGETPNVIGASSNDYFNDRESTTAVYKLNTTGEVSEGEQVLIGYIPKDVAIDGTLTIKAYLDKEKIAISDTYSETSPETDLNGTTTNWVDGRTVLTTSEWISLQNTPISFKVRAESNEGTWVKIPGSIDSCPGCVFTWSYFEDATIQLGQPISGNLIIPLTSNYNEVIDVLDAAYDAYEEDPMVEYFSSPYVYIAVPTRWFLGMKLNSTTNVVERAYICGITNGGTPDAIPFCLEGVTTSDPRLNEVLESNSAIMDAAFKPGECYDGSSPYYSCSEDNGNVYASNDLTNMSYPGVTMGSNNDDISCTFSADNGFLGCQY